MARTQELAAEFMQRAKLSRPALPVIREPINAFHSLFAVQDLTDQENQEIERLLIEGSNLSAEGVAGDAFEIRRLTQELRAIRRQELVLIGERISQAREIFKKYRERSFREWMELAFGAFKTGYNYLSLYDLYLSIPDDMKERLKNIPAKAVYVLASKKAPLDKKIEVVKSYHSQSADRFIDLIRKELGAGNPRGCKTASDNEKIISSMELGASTLLPEHLSEAQKQRLKVLAQHLRDLIR